MSEKISEEELLEINYEDAIEDYDEQVVNMTYELFVNKQYQELKFKISKAYSDKNYQELKVIFHNFKTTSRYLGSENFSELCNQLQIYCKEGVEKFSSFEKAYLIFSINFPKFYDKCKEQYKKIKDSKNSFVKEEETENEDNLENISKISQEVEEEEVEKKTTPKLLSKLSQEIQKDIKVEKPKSNSPSKPQFAPCKNSQKSTLRTISIEFSKEEKITINYHLLLTSKNKASLKSAIKNFLEKSVDLIQKIRIMIQMDQKEKFGQLILDIESTLSIILTEKFKEYLSICYEILVKEKLKLHNPNEFIHKIDKLNEEVHELNEKILIDDLRKSRENVKIIKRSISLRNSDNFNKARLVNGAKSNARNLSKFNSQGIIKELDKIENLIQKANENQDLNELKRILLIFKNFAIQYKYFKVEKELDCYISQVSNSNTVKSFKFYYSILIKELKTLKEELTGLVSNSSCDLFENLSSSLISDLRPHNFRWFFSGNFEKYTAICEETQDVTRNKGNLKQKQSLKVHFEENDDLFNYPFSKNSCCLF